jgi:NADPH:quinone reductase-like Zn-dependent oxidoreductase
VYVDVDHAPLGDVDLVFDLVGGETLRRSCAAVKTGGGVVSVVERPPVATGRHGWFFVVEPSRPQLLELGQRIAAGELRPVVGASCPLRDGRAAFEAKQRGGQPGKAVLLLTDER